MKKHFPVLLVVVILLLLLGFYTLNKEDAIPDDIGLKYWQSAPESAFRNHQLRFKRVSDAYTAKEVSLKKLLVSKGLYSFDNDLFLRAFKKEQRLEVWIKERTASKFRFLTAYPFCSSSGTLGPKRKEGDGQIPEGFYHINHYNPKSTFLLSLRVNYPNASDSILSHPTAPGSDIYIHGGCQTIGCIPITNSGIQELYLLAVEAHNAEKQIPIHIFPTKDWDDLLDESHPHFSFWSNLKEGFNRFEEQQTLPVFSVLDDGTYHFP